MVIIIIINLHHIDANLKYFDQTLKYPYEDSFLRLGTDSFMIHVQTAYVTENETMSTDIIFEIYITKHENNTKDTTK